MTTERDDRLTHSSPVILTCRPRFEGCNVGTWIGFKHIMYLAEEGTLEFLRERGLAPGRLLEEHALCVEIVDSRLRLVHAVEADDLVRIETRATVKPGESELTLGVTLWNGSSERSKKLAGGRVKVAFRRVGEHLGEARPPPPGVAPFVTPELRRSAADDGVLRELVPSRDGERLDRRIQEALVPRGTNAFLWIWRIPYFYCHYTERIQHSGYVRIMEESVDRFLADRGVSIATMLRERNWIPVVLSAQVEILREAMMEETLYTVYTVEEITKDITYTSRMDCYVVRDGLLVRTATGTITHAYCHIKDRGIGASVEPFDQRVLVAFGGPGASR